MGAFDDRRRRAEWRQSRTYAASLQVATIETFSEMWRETSTEADILHTLSCAGEFSNIKVSVTLSAVLSLHHWGMLARANLF